MTDIMLQSRPDRLIGIIDRLMPGLWSRLDKARSSASSRSSDVVLPSWVVEIPKPVRLGPDDPSHMTAGEVRIANPEAYHLFAAEGFGDNERLLGLKCPCAAMYFAWRATKMEFRFDSDLAHELMATPVQGDIPADILRRLPSGCLYVSVDGSEIIEDCCGFFACFDQLTKGAAPVLNLFLDAGFHWPVLMYTLPLSGINLSEFIKNRPQAPRLVQEVLLARCGHPNPSEVHTPEDVRQAGLEKILGKVLSLLLYLCSEEPDLPDDYAPVRIRDKMFGTQRRCIAPQNSSVWPVGVRLGALFRKAAQDAQYSGDSAEGPSGTVRPHVRRAHWHTYWIGPKSAQTALLRWIAPVIVGANPGRNTLSTTVRPVLRE